MYVNTVCPAIPTKASDIRYQSTTLEEHEDFIDFQQRAPHDNQKHPQQWTPTPGPQV